MITWIKKHWVLVAFVCFLTFWTTLLSFISPQELVARIGVENTYAVIFLLATFGGLSAITGTSVFFAIFTFAGGGADPWLLGLAGGIGIFLSDMVFFLAARREVRAFGERANRISLWLLHQFEKLPPWALYGASYVYLGFTPLPNDILMIALAIMRTRLRYIIPIVFVGAITVATITAHIGSGTF